MRPATWCYRSPFATTSSAPTSCPRGSSPDSSPSTKRAHGSTPRAFADPASRALVARLGWLVVASVFAAFSLGPPDSPAAEGGDRRAVGAAFPPSYSPPAWSPTGRRLAFVRYPLRRALGVLLLQSGDGNDARRLYPKRGVVAIRSLPIAWSPDGRAVAFVGDSRLRVLEPSTQRMRTFGRATDFDWAPSGRRIVTMFGEGGGPLEIVSLAGTRRRIGRRPARSPDWSPRGERIAYVDTETGDIRILDVRSGQTARVARGTSPAWSPDGGRLAFYRTTRKGPALDVQTLATRATRTLVPFGVEVSRPPAWSPDGRSLAFSRENEVRIGRHVTTRISLFVVPAVGARTTARRVATVGYTPAFSPDGRTLAFVAPKRGCGSLVYTVRPDGRALRQLSSCR